MGDEKKIKGASAKTRKTAGALTAKKAAKQTPTVDWHIVLSVAARACWFSSAWSVERKKERRAVYQSAQWGLLHALESGDMKTMQAALDAPVVMPEDRAA